MPLYNRLTVGIRSDGRENRRYYEAGVIELRASLLEEHGYTISPDGVLTPPQDRRPCPCGCGEVFRVGSTSWLEGERALQQRRERDARQAQRTLRRNVRQAERILGRLEPNVVLDDPIFTGIGRSSGAGADRPMAEVFAAEPISPPPMSDRVRALLDQPPPRPVRRARRLGQDIPAPVSPSPEPVRTATVTTRPRFVHRDCALP